METPNDELLKAMLAEQAKRLKESKEKMTQRRAEQASGKKTKVVPQMGTTMVNGGSLARAIDRNKEENVKFGNPEAVVIGKREDWDPNKS